MALSAQTRRVDEGDEVKEISDQKMVQKYWAMLPPHIQHAIDQIGAKEAQSLEMMGGSLMMSLKPIQLVARQKMHRIIMDLKSLGELPKKLSTDQHKELERMATDHRAGMLRGRDTTEFRKTNSPYPGIDVMVPAAMKAKIESALAKAKVPYEMETVSQHQMRMRLPRGAYNVTMGGFQLYGDYDGEWTGNNHHYGQHYDEESKKYFEAKGCRDCDQGPDLRNAKPLICLEYGQVTAIHGHQTPDGSNGKPVALPVFFQNPNFLPDGEPKGGHHQKVFYESLSGGLFED